MIYPVPGPDDWPKTNTRDIDPPIFKEGPGRKQVKRKRGQFEVPAPRDSSRMASITCGNCSRVGHRYDHCDKPLKPELQLRKQQHRVSLYLHISFFVCSTLESGLTHQYLGSQGTMQVKALLAKVQLAAKEQCHLQLPLLQ